MALIFTCGALQIKQQFDTRGKQQAPEFWTSNSCKKMGSSRIPHMYLTLAWPYMGCSWPWHHSTSYVSALLPTPVFQRFLHLGDHWSTAIYTISVPTALGTWRLQLSSAIWAALWLVLYCGFIRCYFPTFGYRVPTSHQTGTRCHSMRVGVAESVLPCWTCFFGSSGCGCGCSGPAGW